MSLKIRAADKAHKNDWRKIKDAAMDMIPENNTKHQFEKHFNKMMLRPDENFIKWLAESIRNHFLQSSQ